MVTSSCIILSDVLDLGGVARNPFVGSERGEREEYTQAFGGVQSGFGVDFCLFATKSFLDFCKTYYELLVACSPAAGD